MISQSKLLTLNFGGLIVLLWIAVTINQKHTLAMLYKPGELFLSSVLDTGEQTDHIFTVLRFNLYIITLS